MELLLKNLLDAKKVVNMNVKLLFFLLSLSFPFYNAIAQKNEIQLRYNYIGKHYEPLFHTTYVWIMNAYNTEFSKKINSHPFRYRTGNGYMRPDSSFFSEEHLFSYYYLGLAYQRDSIMGKYFFRFRMDKFSYNHKYSSLIDKLDTLNIPYSGYKRIYTETSVSNIQFTAGFGRTLKWKHFNADLGFELPILFKNDDKFYSYTVFRDSLGEHTTSDANFNNGGFGWGLFLTADLCYTFLKHYSVGIGSSVGIRFTYFYAGMPDFVINYPSLTFGYKFESVNK